MKLLTAGWELNTAYTFNGGQPITIYNGDDTSGTDEFTQRVNRSPIRSRESNHKHLKPERQQVRAVVQPECISLSRRPTPGALIARNSIFGPGFADVDFSVIKNTRFKIHDFPFNVQFRAEMYNLFNHVNLASPACTQLCNDYFGVGSFGRTGSTIGSGNFSPGIGPGEPFNVQLAMKILF